MKKYLLFFCLVFVFVGKTNAQKDTTAAKVEEVKKALADLNESYLETKGTVDALKKIKVRGFIQAQYQSTDGDGAASFAGGNFAANVNNRFMLRRSRIKFIYDNDLTQYVLHFNVSEKGFATQDAYVSFVEPWMKTFGLKAGIFDRPIGFEIEYSSSNRESPERSRLSQTLFPDEGDLGMELEIRPQKGSLSFFNLTAGLFAGNGVNVETDNNKDFIGRLGFSFPFTDANITIDGGVSTYMGKVTVPAGKSIFTLDNANAAGADAVTRNADRNYMGADLQFYAKLPLLGKFSLRGEYISGRQPGLAGATNSTKSFSAAPTDDMYMRNFAGYYLMYVQNLGDRNQLVVKYDSYDPNTDVSGDQIGQNAAAKLGPTDLTFSTFGLGLVHYWDDNVKLVFYYDMVTNETSKNLAGYGDDLKDNVFTFRIQYKF